MTAGTSTTAALSARTREVEPRPDLLDALGAGGFAWLDGTGDSWTPGLVTSGVVARVAPGDAVAFLRAIATDGRADPGPVAVGALPFTDPGDGRLVVPARIERLTADGRAWLTEIGPGAPDGEGAAASAPPGEVGPETFDRSRWRTAVGRALAEIASGRLSKVVLARDSVFEADTSVDRAAVLRRLRTTEHGCFLFADGHFVGASPELLVRRAAGRLVSRPMAGTVAVGAHEPAAGPGALLRSGKDRREHELVVAAVVEAFERLGAVPVRVDGPTLARLASVAHLATRVEGPTGPAGPARAASRSGGEAPTVPTVVDAMLALHPTPAVGGTPVGAALDLIASLEPGGRGRYAGPVGWVDARGDGEFAVAIRSAEISGPRARLFAGAGIVAGSDADAEWDETEAKLEPMRGALGVTRPAG